RSFTACSARSSAATSAEVPTAPCQVFSSSASSARTFASFAASLMRADLMRRMVILSSSSPGEMGTRMSFTSLSPVSRRGNEPLRILQGLVELGGDLRNLDEIHHAALFDLFGPGQALGRAPPKATRRFGIGIYAPGS